MKRQLVRFLIVGGACYFVGLALLFIGTEKLGLHYLASTAMTLLIVNFLGWVLNRKWTFTPSNSLPLAEFGRYFVVNLTGFFLSLILMGILVSFLGVHYLLASAVVAVMMAAINFVLHRDWSFKA